MQSISTCGRIRWLSSLEEEGKGEEEGKEGEEEGKEGEPAVVWV